MIQKIRIGDLLVQNKVLTEEQLQLAIANQVETGHKLGNTLIELGFISEDQLLDTLAEQLNIPLIDLKKYSLNIELVRQLPEIYARRFRSIVLEDKKNAWLVGMVDPLDIFAFDELTRLLGRPIKQALVREKELLHGIELAYSKEDDISGFAEQLSEELSGHETDLSGLNESQSEDSPVAKLVNSLFDEAVKARASDIHIEPDEKVLRIRQRVDGVLREQLIDNARIAQAITQRVKLMAGLDIAEKRLPQDGRFNIEFEGRKVDVRLSTMPIQHGESVVMRLLDQQAHAISLDQNGMPEPILKQFRHLIHQPHGMILVTGPTGSGKTTTLYSALDELNQVKQKIVTVEDPVEYNLPRINQIQVNPKIELDFSRVLRSVLRQDPDIIMVGEIRDSESATIALRAAMTGHLVLATLHTSDTISSVSRLVDMGVENYLIAASLRGILAQRLVRRNCQQCEVEYAPSKVEQLWLSSVANDLRIPQLFKQGKGCNQCHRTGYHGRVGVFELLELDGDMVDALRTNQLGEFNQLASTRRTSRSLLASALEVAAKGQTSLSEVRRLVGEVEDVAPSKQSKKKDQAA